MKTWNISVGGTDEIEGQPISTHIGCEEMPWYVYLIDHYVSSLCCLPIFYWRKKYTLHDIPLPSWPTCYSDELEDWTNPKEYWGDLGTMLFSDIQEKIMQWAWKRTKSWCVPVPWKLLKPHQSAYTIKWVEESFADRVEWEKVKADELAAKAKNNPDPSSNINQSQIQI
jgi:hypothetical protein